MIVQLIGVSFVRDFLEIEQNRSDTNFAYDVTEFTSKFYILAIVY